jgi:RNA polymerase sigma-70 factor (ECF subfamily)
VNRNERDGPDRSLVRRFVAARDEASFRALYARHAAGVFALALRLSGSVSDGEEVLQETWIRAAARLGAFRWDSSLRTWLCGIAVNCWRELRRARASDPVPERFVEDALRPAPVPPAGERIDLERALRALPDGYREVVVLHDVQGYTHGEIAEMLGIDPGTSKSQLSRGRGWLRERLAGQQERGRA